MPHVCHRSYGPAGLAEFNPSLDRVYSTSNLDLDPAGGLQSNRACHNNGHMWSPASGVTSARLELRRQSPDNPLGAGLHTGVACASIGPTRWEYRDIEVYYP